MTSLLDGPTTPYVGEPAEEVRQLEEPKFTSFEVLQDSRILDLRTFNPAHEGKTDAKSLVYGYRRLKVLKRPEHAGNHIFTVDVLATHPNTQVRFPQQKLSARLRKCNLDSPGEKQCRFQASWDFEKVPAGEFVDLLYEHYSPAVFVHRLNNGSSVAVHMQVDTAEVTRWFLMPQGKEYKDFRILKYEPGKPEDATPVRLVTEYLADDYTILAYKLQIETGPQKCDAADCGDHAGSP
jgi:hypothetical protein